MKVEVGYAYYEGNAQVWDTIYVPVKHTVPEEIVTETAIGKALVVLESLARGIPYLHDRELLVAGLWLHSIDNECVVECPECGSYEAVVEKATVSATGDVFFPNAMLEEDGNGFAFDYDGEDRSTEDEIVCCARCGRRGPLDEFTQ